MRLLGRAALWLFAVGAAAQGPVFPPEQLTRIQQGLRDVYGLEHARAIQNFESMIRDAPDDPAGYTYLAYTYLAQELTNKQELSIDRFAASDFFSESPHYRTAVDPAAEQRLRRVSDQAIEKARARLAKNPGDRAALFLLGLAYQNLASFETSVKRNWWAAFRLGNQTVKNHRELLRLDPEFHDARLALGVYNYVSGSLPWSYRWAVFLMGFRGSKQRGKEELELTAQKGLLAADDARLVLTLVYAREKDFEKASRHLSALLKKHPQNYLVHLDLGGMALLRRRTDEAIEIYRAIQQKMEASEAKYAEMERALLSNRLGVAFREKGDLEESARWFEKALAAASARTLTVAHLELGKTLDLLGRRSEAQEQYRQAAAAEDFAGSRQEALELLRRAYRR